MVSEADRGWIEQARIDFEQRFAALEGVIDPFGAGIKISGRASDHGSGRENGGDVVEERIGSFGQLIGLALDQRLVSEAKRVLERVEQLGQLKAEELLGVEPGDSVASIKLAHLAYGQFPKFVQVDIGAIEMSGQTGECPA